MKNLKREDILLLFDNTFIPHVNVHKYNENRIFKIIGFPHIESFDHIEKSCNITYDIVYKEDTKDSIDFQISIKVENNKPRYGLFDESENEEIHEFYKYLQKTKDKYLYAEYMQSVSDNE